MYKSKKDKTIRKNKMTKYIVTANIKVMGGALCIAGTRIPAQTLWFHLKKYSPKEIADTYYPQLSEKAVTRFKKWYSYHLKNL